MVPKEGAANPVLVVVQYPTGHDPARTQTHADGTSVSLRADGVQVARLSGGETNWKYPDGRVVQISKDGSKVERAPDGTSVSTHPDGVVVVAFPGGRELQRNTDGTCIETFPDGRVDQTNPDGSVLHRSANGTLKLTPRSVNHPPKVVCCVYGPVGQSS